MKRAALVAASLIACAADRGTIGAVLGRAPGGELHVRHVEPGLAADQAGVKAGDRVLTVNGLDVRALDETQLRDELRGDVGSRARLTVERGEEIVRVELTRTPARKRRPPGPAASAEPTGATSSAPPRGARSP